MVDVGPEPTYEEKIRVPYHTPWVMDCKRGLSEFVNC